jgi:hypothetical protein
MKNVRNINAHTISIINVIALYGYSMTNNDSSVGRKKNAK